MKAKEFEIAWESGLFSCCLSHVEECNDDVEVGSIITCDYCNLDMILAKCDDGQLQWKLHE